MNRLEIIVGIAIIHLCSVHAAFAVDIGHSPEPKHWLQLIGGTQALMLICVVVLVVFVLLRVIRNAVLRDRK